jgi:NAD(P)-dependent dehydrogenase (short-subunit alcohol dehydrogenase family)
MIGIRYLTKDFAIGGTCSIGQAISLAFAWAGASVIANYLGNEKAVEYFECVASEEGHCVALKGDLTSERSLEQLDGMITRIQVSSHDQSRR